MSTDIVDNTVSPVSIVTNSILEDAAGEEENLSASIQPSAAAAYVQTPQWSIPDPQYVGGYTQSDTEGTSINATVDLTQMTIDFFALEPFSQTTNNQLTFSATSDSPGTVFHAETTYKMDGPSLSLTGTPGNVNVGGITGSFLPVLTAGPTLESGGPSGITWSATWTSNSSFVNGNVGMTQLVGANLYWNPVPPSPGATNPPTIADTTSGYYDLDDEPAYPQLRSDGSTPPSLVSLAAHSSATWSSLDDPFQGLYACTDFAATEDFFQDYFFFQPNPKTNFSSIPVTVGYGEWSYEAYTTKDDSVTTNEDTDWQGPGVWSAPAWTQDIPTITLPQWSGLNAYDVLQAGSQPAC